jgi:protease I
MKSKQLEGQKVLIFVENLFEDLELLYPRYRLMEEGAKVVVAGPKAKETYKSKHEYPCQSDIAFQDVKEEEFDALIIPGGYAPDKMRRYTAALEIVRKFNQKGKPIAFICHAGWVPISAKILKGVKCTSYSSIKDDMINAGANWVDEPVVIDRHIISSRTPDDLPYFCPALIDMMLRARQHAHV